MKCHKQYHLDILLFINEVYYLVEISNPGESIIELELFVNLVLVV
jgi:hypothetical protein